MKFRGMTYSDYLHIGGQYVWISFPSGSKFVTHHLLEIEFDIHGPCHSNI